MNKSLMCVKTFSNLLFRSQEQVSNNIPITGTQIRNFLTQGSKTQGTKTTGFKTRGVKVGSQINIPTVQIETPTTTPNLIETVTTDSIGTIRLIRTPIINSLNHQFVPTSMTGETNFQTQIKIPIIFNLRSQPLPIHLYQ